MDSNEQDSLRRPTPAGPQSRKLPAQVREALAYYTCLIASLQVKVTGFGVETQVNAITVVPDDVLGPWVLAVPPAH